MWAIITAAVCFMLACVMLISGGGNLGTVKTAVEDTIIKGEIDSSMEKRAIYYYMLADDGLTEFDSYLASDLSDSYQYLLRFAAWYAQKPDGTSDAELKAWNDAMPKAENDGSKQFAADYKTCL